MGAPDEPEKDQEHGPDGAEDEAKWLEELGNEPTRILSEGESSHDEDLANVEGEKAGDDVPDWLEGDLTQDVPADEAVPEWLREEMSEESRDEPSETVNGIAVDDVETTAVFATKQSPEEKEIPEWLSDEVQQEQAPDSASSTTDDLSWLDQIAAGEGAAIDEPPTLSWEEQEQTSVSDASVEEEMTWLDDMSTLPGVMPTELAGDIGEMESTEDALSGDDIAEDEVSIDEPIEENMPVIPEADENLSDLPDEVPEDPDEAMAWLESLAARQGAPLEELPTVTDQVLSEIDLDADEMPDDPDEAMDWLEKMAAEQETPAEDLISGLPKDEDLQVVEIAGADGDAHLDTHDESVPDEELVKALTSLEEVEMPGDLDEALSWLEEMVDEAVSEPEPVDKTPTAVEATPPTLLEEEDGEAITEAGAVTEYSDEILSREVEQAAEHSAEAAIQDEVAESEEAMDWLEQLAARQGAPLEELATVDTSDSEPEKPELLQQEIDEVATSENDLAWLETLGTVDADSWLEAEAEASVPDLVVPDAKPDIKLEEVETPGQEDREPAIAAESDVIPVPPDEAAILFADFDDTILDRQHLEAARSAIKSGNLENALDEYTALLQQDEGLPYLIADLESSVENYGQQPKLQRLLGDAYVRNGQLKKAVEVYRQALDNL